MRIFVKTSQVAEEASGEVAMVEFRHIPADVPAEEPPSETNPLAAITAPIRFLQLFGRAGHHQRERYSAL